MIEDNIDMESVVKWGIIFFVFALLVGDRRFVAKRNLLFALCQAILKTRRLKQQEDGETQ